MTLKAASAPLMSCAATYRRDRLRTVSPESATTSEQLQQELSSFVVLSQSKTPEVTPS